MGRHPEATDCILQLFAFRGNFSMAARHPHRAAITARANGLVELSITYSIPLFCIQFLHFRMSLAVMLAVRLHDV